MLFRSFVLTIDRGASKVMLNTNLKIASLKLIKQFTGKESTHVMYELLVYTIWAKDTELFKRFFHYTNWGFLGADIKRPYKNSFRSVVDNIVLEKFAYGRDLLLEHAREARLSPNTIRRLKEAEM